MLTAIIKKVRNNMMRRKQRLDALAHLGKPTYLHISATLHFPKGIRIGKYCRIGLNCHLDGEGGVTIGDGTILAPHVVILSSSHNYNQTQYLPYNELDEKRPVTIGRGCWLGWGVMIVPGVTIGDGAVIAMGSVVTKDVPAGALVGGNPAKIINERDTAFIQQAVAEDRYYLKGVFDGSLKRAGRNAGEDMKTNLIR
jgi:acetyltransferase-like isoleucine patch superfamily enzyme